METDKSQTIKSELPNWRSREAQDGSLDHADRIHSCSSDVEVLTQLGIKLIRCPYNIREGNLLYSEPTNVNINSIQMKHPPETSILFILFNHISKQYGPAEMHMC